MTRRKAYAVVMVALLIFPNSIFCAEEEAPAPPVIVTLGDSTTAGTPFFISPLESPPHGRGDPQGPYSYWMMHAHPDWRVINMGVNGETTHEIRARFEKAYAEHPQYIIILAGVNDIYQGLPLREACKNLEWMYRQIKLQSIMPIAATILPFDRATKEQSEQIRKANEWIKETAERHNIPFLDFHAEVADPEDPTRLNGTPDGLHPDIGSYRKMGKAAAKLIAKLEAAHPR